MDDAKPTDTASETGEEITPLMDDCGRRFNFGDGNVAFQVCLLLNSILLRGH